MLSFFPRGVLDEILNLIESVSEGFPSYSFFTHESWFTIFRADGRRRLYRRRGERFADACGIDMGEGRL